MTRPPARRGPPIRRWAEASVLGILFPASIVAGYLLGRWIARAAGLPEWPAFVGAGLGALGAFINLYRWAGQAGSGNGES